MESNWESRKSLSSYHFDNKLTDPAYDTIRYVGRFVGDWENEVVSAIENSKPVNWETRAGEGSVQPELSAEENDLIQAGADPKLILTNLEYNLAPIFHRMCDAIGLTVKEQRRIHVQFSGQVFTNHIDKLEKFNPENPEKIMRFMIMLRDWEPGHFMEYGNFIHKDWRAGDIYTFDWKNVPHCTANAGLTPRVSLLYTGSASDKTYNLLNTQNATIEV